MGRNTKPPSRLLGRRDLLGAGLAGLTAASTGCLGLFGLVDDSSPPGIFHALDLEDGSTKWTRRVDNAVQSAAAVDGDTVYVGGDDGLLRALSESDGSGNWSVDTAHAAFENNPDAYDKASVTTDVALGAGGIYAGTDQSSILGVDAGTGEKRWQFALESPYTDQMVTTIRSTPAVADGTVAFGVNDHDEVVYGVDARTGNGQWEFETGGTVERGPTAVDGRFYVVDTIGDVYAISAGGRTLWETEITGLTGGSPAVGHGTVFVGSDEGVTALDAETGEELWTTPETSHWVDSQPTVDDESVYAMSRDGTLVAFGLGGEERWTASVGGHASTSPVLAGERIVAGDRDGRIVALDAADGTELWAIETEDPVTATPAIADGTVYVGTK